MGDNNGIYHGYLNELIQVKCYMGIIVIWSDTSSQRNSISDFILFLICKSYLQKIHIGDYNYISHLEQFMIFPEVNNYLAFCLL